MPKKRKQSIHNIEMNNILKESVREALIQLMEVKSFNSITISEICVKAGVSRTGFYRNYKDKKEIIDEFTEEFVNKVQENVGRLITGHVENKHTWFCEYFEYLLENEHIIKTLYDAGFQGPNLNKTNKILINADIVKTDEDKARVIIFNGALHNIALFWLFQEIKVPVEEISNWCIKYLLHE